MSVKSKDLTGANVFFTFTKLWSPTFSKISCSSNINVMFFLPVFCPRLALKTHIVTFIRSVTHHYAVFFPVRQRKWRGNVLCEVSGKCVMCVRPPCSTSTGCVVSVALECVWTATVSAGTGQGRVSHYFDSRVYHSITLLMLLFIIFYIVIFIV